MPKVSGKHFSYSPKGKAAAKKYAKKKGLKVETSTIAKLYPLLLDLSMSNLRK